MDGQRQMITLRKRQEKTNDVVAAASGTRVHSTQPRRSPLAPTRPDPEIAGNSNNSGNDYALSFLFAPRVAPVWDSGWP